MGRGLGGGGLSIKKGDVYVREGKWVCEDPFPFIKIYPCFSQPPPLFVSFLRGGGGSDTK